MRVVSVMAALLLVASCHSSSPAAPPSSDDAGACTSAEFTGAPLGVRCNQLVDAQGRTVLLHGVNARVEGIFDVSFTDGRQALEPIPFFGAADARQMRATGFNALRLPIHWSAIEPTETGGFDEAYLDKVASITSLCDKEQIYVLLDLHQDGYSKEIGEDGAPLWAIVPPPTQLLGGPLTDPKARLESKQVTDAFATFFGDSPDGARLRDRYAKMLTHVAARFAADPAVVGFELYNEPPASDARLAQIYPAMIDAVHAGASQKLVFFEPAATRNVVDRASLGDGSLAAGTVYAPHVYTFVFTGDDATRANVTEEQLRPSNASAREEADSYAAPLAITELGFDPSSPKFADYMRWQFELEDEYLASSFMWLWAEESQSHWGFFDYDAAGVPAPRQHVFDAVKRVRPEAIAGRILHVGYDAAARRFEADFVGSATTDANVVAIGGALASYDATCDGAPLLHGTGDPVTLACGGEGTHHLVIAGQ